MHNLKSILTSEFSLTITCWDSSIDVTGWKIVGLKMPINKGLSDIELFSGQLCWGCECQETLVFLVWGNSHSSSLIIASQSGRKNISILSIISWKASSFVFILRRKYRHFCCISLSFTQPGFCKNNNQYCLCGHLLPLEKRKQRFVLEYSERY